MDSQPKKKSTLLDDQSPKGRLGEAAPPPAPGGETVISGDTIFDGKIIAQSDLRIDGTFKGEIASSGSVYVGPNGKMEATVEAKTLVISGHVVGNLRVLERLELQASCEVLGDLEIQPGALIIEKGARLEGKCTMGLKSEPTPRPTQPAAPKQPAAPNQPSKADA